MLSGAGRNSIPSLRLCGLYGALLSLCIVCCAAFAETPMRNSFSREEMVLISEANLEYTNCLHETAPEQIASSPDVRVVAENTVQICNPVLDELQTMLELNGVNPEFFLGAVTRIKNRAIRRLLPLLMMEKSNQAP